MDIKDYAKMINGKEYGYPEFTEEELAIAKNNGLVIVHGASDDLIEFEGAITDEGDCFEGGRIYFNKKGVIRNKDNVKSSDKVIEALWNDKNALDENMEIIPWTYKTDIPHETFMIMENGKPYCRGIVFSICEV